MTVDLVGTSWPTLDPAEGTAHTSSTQPILSAIYGDLFEVTSSGGIAPGLATSMKTSPDGKVVTIQLRHGVVFSDGTPFDSAAVKFNLQRDMDPTFACLCRSFLSSISSITTPNRYEVRLYLSAPYAPLAGVLSDTAATFMVSPKAVQSEGEQKFGINPVGAGPFKVLSNTVSSQITLVRNPRYWNHSEPKLSKITFVNQAVDSSAYAALQTGQAQIMYGTSITPQVAREASRTKGLKEINPPSTWWDYLLFGVDVAPFNNPLAREAVLYATNPAALNKSLYYGKDVVTETMTAPGESIFAPKVAGYPTYNPAKAEKLVKRLGGLSFTIIPLTNSTYWTQLASALQQQWARVGIHATVDALEETASLQHLFSHSAQVYLGNYGGYTDPALSIGNFILCKGAFNDGLCNPTVDTLFNAGNSARSASARAADYKKMFSVIAKNYYQDMLWAKEVAWVRTTKVEGVPNLSVLYFKDAYLK